MFVVCFLGVVISAFRVHSFDMYFYLVVINMLHFAFCVCTHMITFISLYVLWFAVHSSEEGRVATSCSITKARCKSTVPEHCLSPLFGTEPHRNPKPPHVCISLSKVPHCFLCFHHAITLSQFWRVLCPVLNALVHCRHRFILDIDLCAWLLSVDMAYIFLVQHLTSRLWMYRFEIARQNSWLV